MKLILWKFHAKNFQKLKSFLHFQDKFPVVLWKKLYLPLKQLALRFEKTNKPAPQIESTNNQNFKDNMYVCV